jgi:catechol 2,3-dioxygenase-like lactoylglutathione lyase family enzyme
MRSGISTVIYPVNDLARAKALYGALLGIEPYADQPYYVGFRVGDHEIGLDPRGASQGMTGPVPYYEVDDIRRVWRWSSRLADRSSNRSGMSAGAS